jgi:hypothetical protein
VSEKLTTRQQLWLIGRHNGSFGTRNSHKGLFWRQIHCMGEQKRCIVPEPEVQIGNSGLFPFVLDPHFCAAMIQDTYPETSRQIQFALKLLFWRLRGDGFTAEIVIDCGMFTGP